MSRNHPQNRKDKKPLDEALISNFIEVQKDQIALEKNRLELEKENMKNQVSLAKESLKLQGKFLDKAPAERRKDRRQYLLFAGLIFFGILGFAIYCLHYKHHEFLKYFVGVLSHIISLVLGYYFGNRNKSVKKEAEEFTDYEDVVD